MKIWVDDIHPAPEGYVWCTSVNKTIETIEKFESAVEKYLDRKFAMQAPCFSYGVSGAVAGFH